MKPDENLFLVGPMGVGKTTIGKLIAKKLGRVFVDLDEEIELRAGATIPWIFDVEGEQGFRRRETELLAECSVRQNLVVSTGGGVVLKEENRHILRESGVVIYLNATVDQLYERTIKDKKRPLLQVPDRKRAIREIKTARDPLYREVADMVVDVGNRNSRHVTDLLFRQLQKLSNSASPHMPV